MRNLTSLSGGETEACFECDGFPSPCEGVRFGPGGFVFTARRAIEPMCVLVLFLEWNPDGGVRCRQRREGVVIDCRKLAGGVFEVTVVLVCEDAPCAARELAHSLN